VLFYVTVVLCLVMGGFCMFHVFLVLTNQTTLEFIGTLTNYYEEEVSVLETSLETYLLLRTEFLFTSV
jgi:hypothetical protein